MKHKAPKLRPPRCPYCKSIGIVRDPDYVYGSGAQGDKMMVCSRYPDCDSYSTINPQTGRAGVMANADLRRKRIEAHRAFDQLWKTGRMSRSGAYHWLASRMGLHRSQAHISQFSEYMCEMTIKECSSVLQTRQAS